MLIDRQSPVFFFVGNIMSDYKNGDELFDDLVNVSADEWNKSIADGFGITIEQLQDYILTREIDSTKKLIKLKINKAKVKKLGNSQINVDKQLYEENDDDSIYEASLIEKFTVTLSDDEKLVDSIALTGKIIIGFDFSKSKLTESYFCHCTFYNCKFDYSTLNDSTITNCNFTRCSFIDVDFTGCTIARSKILECTLNHSNFEYANISDCSIILSFLNSIKISQARLLFTGFSDTDIDKSDWKDSTLVQCSLSNVKLTNNDLRRASFIDSIFIRVDFTGADFELASVTCITSAMCFYDPVYKDFFEMSRSLYSPSVFEWENEELNEDDEDKYGGW